MDFFVDLGYDEVIRERCQAVPRTWKCCYFVPQYEIQGMSLLKVQIKVSTHRQGCKAWGYDEKLPFSGFVGKQAVS